ncbi:hypothetical protein LINPERPRIM_LOCUS27755 [Linum perenne]
MCRRGVPRD